MSSGEAVYQQLVSYRTGDMWSPNVEQVEALKMEAAYFIDCIMKDKRPFNDGQAGLRIVRMLEAADSSLQHKGSLVRL
jgi:predicted dehydrogenase